MPPLLLLPRLSPPLLRRVFASASWALEARQITTYAITTIPLVPQTPVPTGPLHTPTVQVVVVVVRVRTGNVPYSQTVWCDTSRCGVDHT